MSPEFSHLRSVLATRLGGRRAVVVGDVMLDRYVVGQVGRISPEAPVPIVQLEEEHTTPGGAANVATNLAGLGLTVSIAGWTGEDDERIDLLESLHSASVDTSAVVGFPDRSTTAKTRILAATQQLVRVDHEQVGPLPSTERAAFDHRVMALFDSPCDVVILSDYAKGVLHDHLCRSVISRGNELGIPVLVDPKGLSFAKYSSATAVTPNAAELAAAGRVDAGDVPALLRRATELRDELHLEALIVTRGGQGMSVIDRDGIQYVPAHAREVFDVSGAGDTAVASLAACAAAGLRWRESAVVANIAAGLAVSHAGTVTVTLAELLEALVHEDPGLGTLGRKVVDLETAKSLLGSWRGAGDVIGFTNGCFDLLHAGHVSYLDWASQHCDRLIVGLNTDSSVREQKGPGRPVVGERERATVLAGLAAVDAVVPFDQPTPIELIEALRPDLLVKGGDYREDQIVGATEIKRWGGRVLVAPLVEGESTTALVGRVQEAG